MMLGYDAVVEVMKQLHVKFFKQIHVALVKAAADTDEDTLLKKYHHPLHLQSPIISIHHTQYHLSTKPSKGRQESPLSTCFTRAGLDDDSAKITLLSPFEKKPIVLDCGGCTSIKDVSALVQDTLAKSFVCDQKKRSWNSVFTSFVDEDNAVECVQYVTW